MWNICEEDLDKNFMGQWEITRVDDYLTQKSGTEPRDAILRSKVEGNVIKLYSHLPSRYGLDPIIVDGSHGICGRITERIKIDDTKTNVNFLYLKVVKPKDIISSMKKVAEGMWTITGEAEIDDVVFNAKGDYTFPFTYHLKGDKQPYLWGLSLEIPIEKYNHYIKMRDIWYNDYEGSKIIIINNK